MIFYRYEAVQYAEHDYDGELVSPKFPNPSVELRKYDMVKETPKGYWIGYVSPIGRRIGEWARWVSKTSKKRYAYPTKEEALNNFIKRSEKRVKILKHQVTFTEIAINVAKQIKL